MAKRFGLTYVEASAKSNIGLIDMFEKPAQTYVDE